MPVAQVVVSSAVNGVLPTLGDVNGDGQIDLILAPDDGRPELVRIFEIDSGEVLGDVPGNLPGFRWASAPRSACSTADLVNRRSSSATALVDIHACG